MKDSSGEEKDQVNKQNALTMEFITEANVDLERLRLGAMDLAELEPTSWRRVQHLAHNIGARAAALKLGVLQICARELEQFSIDVLKAGSTDRSECIQGAMVALEMLDLELQALKRNVAGG
jgi:hypothetical protein